MTRWHSSMTDWHRHNDMPHWHTYDRLTWHDDIDIHSRYDTMWIIDTAESGGVIRENIYEISSMIGEGGALWKGENFGDSDENQGAVG